MKFIIWGTGIRGKRIANFIGLCNIVAFVDSDKKMQKKDYEGIPIIDIDEYYQIHSKYLLIISPMENKEIISILEKMEIYSYLIFEDCPMDMKLGLIEEIRDISFPKINYDNAIVHGSSLYSILVWEHLIKEGYNTTLVMADGNEQKLSLLKKVSQNVYCRQERQLESFEFVIQTTAKAPDSNSPIINLFDLKNYVKKFYYESMEKFKNLFKERRCVIVGNGPSLSVEDLDKLHNSNVICFGMNGIPLIMKYTKWVPDYYVCEDSKMMELFHDLVVNSQIENILLADTNKQYYENMQKIKKVDIFHLEMEEYSPSYPPFSENIEKCVYSGYTVTYACIQIAVYMGFREIYLLGIDFDYNEGETIKVEHFVKEYYSDTKKINPSRKQDNLLAYQAARKYADSHDIKIYNATRGGKLEVFERVDFDKLF